MPKIVLPPGSAPDQNGSIRGGWWHTAEDSGKVVCDLCPRECHLGEGDRGFCFVRQNVDGEMRLTTYGRSTGFCIDPIEKKPLNHFYPGTAVLSFGTAGCNLGCKFCQNWDISKSREIDRLSELALPEMIAEAAVQTGCRSVACTYNDPVIWAEYAVDTAKACRERGVKSVAVTAGYICPEARPTFFHAMDAANVDLKAFTENFYEKITYSHLQPVLETLEWLKQESDVWVEITNLIIPNLNDSSDDLRRMCDWIVQAVGRDVPVHFTAFHPDFRLMDQPRTPVETLLRARQIAMQQGLRFVYVGNVHDTDNQSTWCPGCGELLIERDWHLLGTWRLDHGRCRSCGESIPGHFDPRPGSWGARRQPVRISEYTQPSRREKQTPPAMDDRMDTVSECPALSEPQRKAIHRYACCAVAATVTHERIPPAEELPSELSRIPVMGAFVTVRREGQLRSCCGALGQPMELQRAVFDAAKRTASEDPRFPALSATELEYLELDVTLLFNFQTVNQTGTDRVAAVEIGKHGLRIQRGRQAGLLLPTVPVEHNWDAETFLDQVCRKAGLPVTAWQDADTQLTRFEGTCIPGRLTLPDDSKSTSSTLPNADQLATLREFAQANLRASVTGAVPGCFPANVSDGTVHGVIIAVRHNPSGQTMMLSRRQLREGLPLQMTLLELIQAAARHVREQSLNDMSLEICLLTDPAVHGTIANADLRGINPNRRAVLVSQSERVGCIHDPESLAEETLKRAVAVARLNDSQPANVYSLAAASSSTPFEFSSAPAPDERTASRVPAVAGTFYPADPTELNSLLDQCFGEVPDDTRECGAVMLPHAGMRFSGRIAADVLKQVRIPETVIVIGPKHTRDGSDWAIAPHESWQTPVGDLESDQTLIQLLADSIDGLEIDAVAHAREHAIEMELPFLARLSPSTKVIGIVVGSGDLDRCRRFGRQLADVLRSLDPRPMLAVSSDMNHFASDADNRRLDEMALTAMESLQPDELYQVVQDHNISMCGVLPAVIVMEALHQLDGLKDVQRVSYATSADVTGDTRKVVGYAGAILNESMQV